MSAAELIASGFVKCSPTFRLLGCCCRGIMMVIKAALDPGAAYDDLGAPCGHASPLVAETDVQAIYSRARSTTAWTTAA